MCRAGVRFPDAAHLRWLPHQLGIDRASMPATGVSADASCLFRVPLPRFQGLMSDGTPELLLDRRPTDDSSRGTSGPSGASSANSAREEPDTTSVLRRCHHDNAAPAHGLTRRPAAKRSRLLRDHQLRYVPDQRTHVDADVRARTCSDCIRRGRQPLCPMRGPHRHEQARREPRRARRYGGCGS